MIGIAAGKVDGATDAAKSVQSLDQSDLSARVLELVGNDKAGEAAANDDAVKFMCLDVFELSHAQKNRQLGSGIQALSRESTECEQLSCGPQSQADGGFELRMAVEKICNTRGNSIVKDNQRATDRESLENFISEKAEGFNCW